MLSGSSDDSQVCVLQIAWSGFSKFRESSTQEFVHLIAFHRKWSPQSKTFWRTSVLLAKAGPSGGRGKGCLPGRLSEERKSWERESWLSHSACAGCMQAPSNRDTGDRYEETILISALRSPVCVFCISDYSLGFYSNQTWLFCM